MLSKNEISMSHPALEFITVLVPKKSNEHQKACWRRPKKDRIKVLKTGRVWKLHSKSQMQQRTTEKLVGKNKKVVNHVTQSNPSWKNKTETLKVIGSYFKTRGIVLCRYLIFSKLHLDSKIRQTESQLWDRQQGIILNLLSPHPAIKLYCPFICSSIPPAFVILISNDVSKHAT